MMGSALGAIGSIGGALIGLSDESTKHTVEKIEDALATLRDLNQSPSTTKKNIQ